MSEYNAAIMDNSSPAARPKGSVLLEYRPLHLYLKNRFADTVVLTFAQIEDLLGHALPSPARLEEGWWANPDADGRSSDQAQTWVLAERTATANMVARTVTFARA